VGDRRREAVGRKKKPRRGIEPRLGAARLEQILLDSVRNVRERGVQVCSDGLHCSDNRNRNASRDQAVFDGGRA